MDRFEHYGWTFFDGHHWKLAVDAGAAGVPKAIIARELPR